MASEIARISGLHKHDFFEILNLHGKISKSEYKKAFRDLSLQYHPDKYKGDDKNGAEEVMKRINLAKRFFEEQFQKYKEESTLSSENYIPNDEYGQCEINQECFFSPEQRKKFYEEFENKKKYPQSNFSTGYKRHDSSWNNFNGSNGYRNFSYGTNPSTGANEIFLEIHSEKWFLLLWATT